MRRGTWVRVVFVLAVVGLIAAFYLSGLNETLSWEQVRGRVGTLQEQVQENLPAAVVVFFLVYVAVTGLSLPVAAVLSLLAGALFGRWVGVPVVSVAATAGATLAMFASRYVLRDWVQRRFGHRLAGLNRGVERDGGYYLLTLRLIPAVPFWLLNLGVGLTPLRTRTYVLVSWVGMLPGTFLFVNAGTELAKIEHPRDVVSPGVLGAFVLLAVVPLALKWVIGRYAR